MNIRLEPLFIVMKEFVLFSSYLKKKKKKNIYISCAFKVYFKLYLHEKTKEFQILN